MDSLKSRQLTVDTYNEKVADEIADKIIQGYFKLFVVFQAKMENLRSGGQGDIFKEE